MNEDSNQKPNYDDHHMPIWLDDKRSIDCKWISQKIGISNITSCIVRDISHAHRHSGVDGNVCDGGTLLLSIQYNTIDNNTNKTIICTKDLIMKQISETNGKQKVLSQQLGLVREAFFYSNLAILLPTTHNMFLPNIYYSYGNENHGTRCILMDYLNPIEWLDSGIFFGPGNPNNWNRGNLKEILCKSYGIPYNHDPDPSLLIPPHSHHVTKVTFERIAQIHAFFWKKQDLLQPNNNWLRGSKWRQNQLRDTWEQSQFMIRDTWYKYVHHEKENEQKESKEKTFIWDPIVRQTIEKAISSISWDTYIKQFHIDTCQWTLVHGDFWPGNVMWNINKDNTKNSYQKIQLLDWEMVGIGSGPQDLGQYIISNMNSKERRECEYDIIHSYYNELKRYGSSTNNTNIDFDIVTYNYVFNEYIIGGIERWLWFLVWFLGQQNDNPSLNGWAQYFHNQISEFMNDHNITANDITQPRP